MRLISTLLVILATYGVPPAYFGPADIGYTMRQVNAFYSEVSYGKQTFAHTNTPWLQLANKPATCDYIGSAQAADTAAKAAGIDPMAYEFRIYVIDQGPPCGWAGLSYVGSRFLWINRVDSFNFPTVTHELGHALGLRHAGSWRCAGGIVVGGTNCGLTEYGDRFDIMGGPPMHFNAVQKQLLGWLPPGAVVTHTGGYAKYELTPISQPGGSVYAVKQTVNGKTYWAEYRAPIGFDSTGLEGVQLRMTGDGCCDSLLLDLQPGTVTLDDASMPADKKLSSYGIVSFDVTRSGAVIPLAPTVYGVYP